MKRDPRKPITVPDPAERERARRAVKHLYRKVKGGLLAEHPGQGGVGDDGWEYGEGISFENYSSPVVEQGRIALKVGYGTYCKWFGTLGPNERREVEDELSHALYGMKERYSYDREAIDAENSNTLARIEKDVEFPYWQQGDLVLLGGKHPEETRLRVELFNGVDPPTGVRHTGMVRMVRVNSTWKRDPGEILAYDVSDRARFESAIKRVSAISVTYPP